MRSIHLPRLSRRGKIIRNLALAAAVVLSLWVGTERGPWTVNGALRQLEAELLLEPGRTVHIQTEGVLEHQWAFVLGDEYAYTAVVRRRDLDRSFWSKTASVYQAISLEGEPGLLSLSDWSLLGQQESWRLFCPQGPAGATSARLTVEALCQWKQSDGTRSEQVLCLQGEAARDENGVYAFLLQADTPEEEMALTVLMGGSGYEEDETGRWKRTCQVLETSYRLDFTGPAGEPAGRSEGVLT